MSDLAADVRPPTDDHVPIDRDGNRLDSTQKEMARLERINQEGSEQPA